MQNSAQVNKKSAHQKKNQTPLALQWLMETFPRAFFARSREVRPLQIGIFDEILNFQARLSTPPYSKKALREALNYYSASTAYLRCQMSNAPRLDLFGTVVDHVTEDQANYAQERYAARSVKGAKHQKQRAEHLNLETGEVKPRDNIEEEVVTQLETPKIQEQRDEIESRERLKQIRTEDLQNEELQGTEESVMSVEGDTQMKVIRTEPADPKAVKKKVLKKTLLDLEDNSSEESQLNHVKSSD